MKIKEYIRLKNRLWNHATRIFQNSNREEFTTVRRAARSLNVSQKLIVQAAEDLKSNGEMEINVAIGITGVGYADLATAEWQLEPCGGINDAVTT